MNQSDVQSIAHDLAYGKFMHLLVTKYRDVELTDNQIYMLYQSVFTSDWEDMINNGSSESLPF